MRRRGLVSATILLSAAFTGIPANAEPAQQAQQPEPPKTVTLITGDKVTVAKRGATWDVKFEPARRMGESTGYLKHISRDNVTVIPQSAAHLVRTGRLDQALFDITGLIKQGYDDAHTPDVPLLVENGPSVQALGRVTRQLAQVSAVATPKNRAAELFDAAGATKIWLNGKAYPTLDESVQQVRAPAAWQAGHTGAGASIAVLDTGYDPAHPDLAGVVKGERDFIGTGIRDTVGHGTHVASTVAGRGTASGGKYTGVAKGANLLVGKVCDAWGCPFDAILDGMQWAADSGARVVNMSLGGNESDGTDPISMAVNRISAERGTLFVVAAGNAYTFRKVSSPAAADAALAVGSVNKQDAPSVFSSQGPRFKDFALKPDIAAPGESIVAARAAGTLGDVAVDEHYARLNGTSMATPHVAGAAGILAVRHPSWTGEQIKAALMSSANPVAATVYQQGAGRLDVARAVTQQVTASPASLSMGFVKWPHNAPAASKRITYKNSGTTPVSLSVTLDVRDEQGQPAPAGAFTADVNEVTVPAGGEATVTVRYDHKLGQIATYGGRVVARGGDTVVQTAIGATKEPESYELTTRVTDRNGAVIPPASRDGFLLIASLERDTMYITAGSNESVRLRAGRYAVLGYAASPIAGQVTASYTNFAEPEVILSGGDKVIDVDTRKGNRVGFQVDEKDARVVAGVSATRAATPFGEIGTGVNVVDDMYAVPTQGKHDGFRYYNRAQLERPEARLNVSTPAFEVPVDWSPTSPKTTGARSLTAIDAGYARPDEIAARDLRGKLAVFTLTAAESEEFDARVAALHAAGASAALLYWSERMSVGTYVTSAIPVVYTLRPDGARLAKLGTAGVTLTGYPQSPYRYELALPSFGAIPADVTYEQRNRDLATVRSKYHSIVDGGVGYLDFLTAAGDLDMSTGLWSTRVHPPLERTEYYSAGPVRWQTSLTVAPGVDGGAQHAYLNAERTYRPGEQVPAVWNKAVIGPSFTVSRKVYTDREHHVYRESDTISASLPLFSDGAGHAGMTEPAEYSFADKGSTVLYSADGKEIGRSDVPGDGTFTVPADAAKYRLAADVTRTSPIWPLSTKVSAEWGFRSAHNASAAALPLLTVGFDPKVDLADYASRGWASFPIRVDRQPGSTGGAVSLRKVEVSFDDGASWKPVPLVKIHDRWWTVLENPRSGFVSLRASASDTDGNTVDQTVIRAYRVR